MATIRCPMCGESNPEELEICQHCQARLKPFIANQSPAQPKSNQPSASSKKETPDWLHGLRNPETGFPESSAFDFSDEEPEDWMADLRFDAPTDRGQPPKEAPPEPADQQPEWLQRVRSRKREDELQAQQESPSDDRDQEMPDWLEGWRKETEDLPESMKLPDWMPIPQTSTPAAPDDLDNVPDWMSGILSTNAVSPSPVSKKPGITSTPPEGKPAPKPDDLSWLDQLQAVSPPSSSKPQPASPSESDTGLFAQEDKNQFQTPPLEEAELPDWLMATPQDQEADHKESPISQAQPDEMAPAHLPSWLEAMRPVEAVISMTPLSEEGADVVESAGPLAGLRALLPAEPEAALSRKTSTLSVKLQVPEKQQTHATLLSELIKSEGEVRPLPGRSVVTGQYTLRLIIVVVLLLSLLWPLIPGAPQVQVPALPGEGLAFKQIIENLEPGAPVLVAFDYQPGLSGEMDAATDSVIVHLVNRSVFLTLVSTIPTGPLQAESLLNRIRQRGGPDILTQDQYTNLGYIPGGQTGLRSLAEFPRQIVPYPLTSSQTGGNTWDQPALQNIQAISGFRLVVVATDNPDVARAWIEQVQTSSPNLPLVMIVSAQAEPLVRPYYENNPRQIQGMVSGLAGGAAYEAATGQISSAAPHWTGFSISALIAGLLISLGGLANIVIGLYGQTKKTTDGEATR